MSELKPCPFCGGKARVNTLPWMGGYTATALCKNEPNAHYLNTWDEDEAKAVERITAAWNTRAERTCCMTDRGECSECGAYIVRAWTEVHDFNGDMKRIDLRSHNYCPNCGAKVVSE